MQAGTVGVLLLFFATMTGCLASPAPQLEVGDLWNALAADPQGGMFMLFNFTLYNNGSGEAQEIFITIDGLNRTPPERAHYGKAERSLQGLPPGGSFVIEGRLDVYNHCRADDPQYSECATGTTYFTIRADPDNGPPVVKVVEDESNYFY